MVGMLAGCFVHVKFDAQKLTYCPINQRFPFHTNHKTMHTSSQVRPLSGGARESVARALALPDLLLPFPDYRRKVPMHHIVRLQGEGNYTRLHFADGSQLMVSLTLKVMERRLDSSVFARSHKKNIVNLLYLSDFHPTSHSLEVSLINGDRVEVSRRKAPDFIREALGFQDQIQELVN